MTTTEKLRKLAREQHGDNCRAGCCRDEALLALESRPLIMDLGADAQADVDWTAAPGGQAIPEDSGTGTGDDSDQMAMLAAISAIVRELAASEPGKLPDVYAAITSVIGQPTADARLVKTGVRSGIGTSMAAELAEMFNADGLGLVRAKGLERAIYGETGRDPDIRSVPGHSDLFTVRGVPGILTGEQVRARMDLVDEPSALRARLLPTLLEWQQTREVEAYRARRRQTELERRAEAGLTAAC